MHEAAGALNLASVSHRSRLHSHALTSRLFSVLLSSQLHAYQPEKEKKAESCSRCVALADHCVTCRLNCFQEEPQKLKTFLTMNVSEDQHTM